jgi:hypothetical protein
MKFQSLSSERKEEFVKWFNEVFHSDIAASFKKVVELDAPVVPMRPVVKGEMDFVEEVVKKPNAMAERWQKVIAPRTVSANEKMEGDGKEKENNTRSEEIFAIMGKPIEEEGRKHGWVKMFPDELLGK